MNAIRTDRTTAWLLAIDGSPGADHAARYVAAVARRLGVSEIRVLSARFPAVGSERTQAIAAIRKEAFEAAERTTASARRILAFAGLEVRLEAPVGDDPAAMITAASQRPGVSEIIMGTRGVTALANLALGSVAYKVLHLARRPVTLVPSPSETGRSPRSSARGSLNILLAVDGSAAANRAVDYVARLGVANANTAVHLLNVQPKISSGNVRRFIAQADIDRYYQELGMKALRGPIRLLQRAGVKHEDHVRTGPLADTIVDAADELGCARIVMGTRGLGAAGALLLGSVTYGVVHRADRPVTIVKQVPPPPLLLGESRQTTKAAASRRG